MLQSLLQRSRGLFNVAVELGSSTGVVVFTDTRGRHLQTHLQDLTPGGISVKVYPGFSLKRLSDKIVDYLDRTRTVSTVYVLSGIEELMVQGCLGQGKAATLKTTDVEKLTKHVISEVDNMVKQISKRFPRVKLVLCPLYGLDIAVYNKNCRDQAEMRGKGGRREPRPRGNDTANVNNAKAQSKRGSDVEGAIGDERNVESKVKKSTKICKGKEPMENSKKKGSAGLKARFTRNGLNSQNVQGGMQGMELHLKGVEEKELALQVSEEMIQETLEEAILLINRHVHDINSTTGVLTPRVANMIHPYSVESHDRHSQYWRLRDGFLPSNDFQQKLAALITCAVADNRKLGFHK